MKSQWVYAEIKGLKNKGRGGVGRASRSVPEGLLQTLQHHPLKTKTVSNPRHTVTPLEGEVINKNSPAPVIVWAEREVYLLRGLPLSMRGVKGRGVRTL